MHGAEYIKIEDKIRCLYTKKRRQHINLRLLKLCKDINILLFLKTYIYHLSHELRYPHVNTVGRDSSVGIATGYGLDGPGMNPGGGEIFCTCPDRPWGPPSLLYNGYRVFPGGKLRPGRGVDHSPPFSPRLRKEYSYTSTPPLGLRGLF